MQKADWLNQKLLLNLFPFIPYNPGFYPGFVGGLCYYMSAYGGCEEDEDYKEQGLNGEDGVEALQEDPEEYQAAAPYIGEGLGMGPGIDIREPDKAYSPYYCYYPSYYHQY